MPRRFFCVSRFRRQKFELDMIEPELQALSTKNTQIRSGNRLFSNLTSFLTCLLADKRQRSSC